MIYIIYMCIYIYIYIHIYLILSERHTKCSNPTEARWASELELKLINICSLWPAITCPKFKKKTLD